MRLLALDTAASRCSVALFLDGALTERSVPAERIHAESVLPMVEELLSGAGLRLKGLDAIAFGRGPGAFTGLRVAAAVAQGLAYGAGLPVVPVSNLAALAHAAFRGHGARRVLACLDARMHEVYWAAYACGADSIEPLSEETLCPPDQLIPPDQFIPTNQSIPPDQFIPPPPPGHWFAAGSGWDAYGQALKARLPSLEGMDASLLATAGDVVRLAEIAFKKGGTVTPEQATPVYLRDKVATPKI